MPALLRGLDLSDNNGQSQGLRMWIMLSPHFLCPVRIARLPKNDKPNAHKHSAEQ